MKIGASRVSREKLTLFGYSDDEQVEYTLTFTLDEIISLCKLLNEAADVMREQKPGDEAIIPPK
jgi:hypothetical protein